jgi:hypothetical protein
VGDVYNLVPQPEPCDTDIGWVLGIGDTIEEAINHAKENAASLEGQPVTVHTEFLADSLKAAHEEEEEGIQFSPNGETIPEPAIVIE